MGDRLGRYVVLRHLASGGMADVLLARTDGIEGFARHVVLKRIKPEHARDQRFMTMFLDEARLAANLHHGNIVQVFDIGESNGEYFFAMEYLHGEDLRAILSTVAKQRSHVPLGHVIGIVAAAAAGLHHAHERRGPDKKPLGIVHRDVSPSNILIGYDGTPKLVDFGIAKAAARNETRTGTLKGKVAYMSPEQCKSEPVDRRSDVYALGVVLYELATTTRLFKGDSDYLVMDAICNGKIPLPRVRRPELPNELSVIIMKALATEPGRRFQSADELRVALENFALSFGLSTSTSGLADYMHKLFGDKPEPWLDDSTVDESPLRERPSGTAASASLPTELGRRSWADNPGRRSTSSSELEAIDATSNPEAGIEEPKTITNGSMPQLLAQAAPARSVSPTLPPLAQTPVTAPVALMKPIAIDPTRTSTKLAWEPAPVPSLRTWSSSKTAVVVLVAMAVLGVGAWKLVTSTGDDPVVAQVPVEEPTVAAAATAAAAAPPIVDAAPIPTATATPIAVTAAPNTPTPTPTTAPAHDVTVRRPVAPAPAPRRIEAAHNAPSPSPSPSPISESPTPTPTPTPIAPAPVAPIAPVVVAPVVVAPVVIEPTIAHLSDATVQAVARDHGAELSKCEADGMHGEITVRFQIDAAGRVTKKQLSSTLGKPKVAGCILASLGHWQFPKPPSGSADGSYTLSFQ